jgi:hypothetical protein
MADVVGRRSFLRTASAGAALAAVSGSTLLEACSKKKDDTAVGAGGGTTTTAKAGGGGETTTSGSSTAPQVFRLSTRHDTGACTACQKHAHNKVFTTQAAADSTRAHKGCNCEIVSTDSDAATMKSMFKNGATVFDRRRS